MMNDSNGSRSSSHISISSTSLSHASEPMSTIWSGSLSGVQEHSPPMSKSSCWILPIASSAALRTSSEMLGIRLSSILTTPTCELTSSMVP